MFTYTFPTDFKLIDYSYLLSITHKQDQRIAVADTSEVNHARWTVPYWHSQETE
jgi:hypothetical protein